MAIRTGDKLPSVIIKSLTASGMQDVPTETLFAGKKVIMFAIPGAFTPTCSAKHLPGYIQHMPELKALGAEVFCLSINDPFVMKAWSDQHKADAIKMIADGNGTFTRALGLEMDGTAYGLGVRAQRFALYAEDGVVKYLAVEQAGSFDVSSAEAMLKAVGQHQVAAA